ncbi:MAG: NTP transferase domain-containing protein [Acidimicrobiia bacterium]
MTDAGTRPRPANDPAAHGGTTVAVVLAAGGGSRFRGPTHKLLAVVDGAPLARRAVEAARLADIGPVVVVVGAVDPLGDDVPDGVTVIHHAGWADGQATSLQAGLDTARRMGATAVVVGLADQPFVTSDAWRAVAASTAPIAVATYGERRRNPVRLAADVWPLVPATGDEGARTVIRMRPELVEEVPCSGSPDDIDTWEDLESWQSRSSTNSP